MNGLPSRVVLSSLNWTLVTPTLSEAVALTVTVPDTMAAEAGEVMATVGGVVSGGGLLTVTVMGAEVALLPEVSVAMAVSVCVALVAAVVFQDEENGEVVTAEPRLTPSS